MINAEMYRAKDGILEFKGTAEYYDTVKKERIIDGETYVNTKRILVKKNISDIKESEFQEYNYEFKELNITETIRFPQYFNNFIYHATNREYTQSEYVNAIVHAFSKGLLDNRIIDIFRKKSTSTTNDEHYHHPIVSSYEKYFDIYDKIKETGEVEFFLTHYGSGNLLFYKVKLEDVLKLDKEHLPKSFAKEFKIK